MEAYYYNKMTREEQSVYRDLLDGLNQLKPEIQVLKLPAAQLSTVFFQLRLDHPELFWAPTFQYKFYPDSPNLIVVPEYLFEKNKIKEQQKAMKARVEKLARPAKGLKDIEKELYVHDFICSNVQYDKLKKFYSHEIIGPLGQGVGVCEGIAKAVKVLCDAIGLWCIIAICGNNPEKGIKYRHTWNIIRLDGKYYHLDATFDNTLGRTDGADKPAPLLRYDYFNLDDKAVFRDHEPLIAPAPQCEDNSRFYYKEKKLSFTRMEDVANRAKQAAKKGKPLVFHWRGGYLTREVMQELVTCMRDAGAERNKTAQIRVNWPQAVISVQYTDMPPEATTDAENVVMEEANEGEQIAAEE